MFVIVLESVTKRFSGVTAVEEVSLVVETGEIRCLVGPNGAGKTTLFNLVAGALRPTMGRIEVFGRDVTGLGPRALSRMGVVRKYQAPSLFDELTARRNLEVAADGRRTTPGLLRRSRSRMAIEQLIGELGFEPGRLDVAAAHLSHGERQWLEIGMVLINEPRVLLLDEPTAGMTRSETQATEALIRRVSRARNLTTVVIEHDIAFVRALADRITVLHRGRVLTEGAVDDVERNPDVISVYLGEG